MIRTIIVDDEPSAVSVLATLLRKKCKDDVEVIASSSAPGEGRELIEKHSPDLVFLDIEMPGMSGIDIVRSFRDPKFHVVFVTAHDNYAVQAFELCAVNYLLKPVGPETVMRTIEKVKEEIRRKQNNSVAPLEKLEKLFYRHSNSSDSKIGIAMSEKIVFVNIGEIIFCEANSAYTNVHLQDGRKMVASKPLGYFEVLLTNHKFFRIHHSYLINLNRIKEFQKNDGGYVIMENNKQLEVSRRKRTEFLDAIDDFVV
jgi:two-component system, LytTR family, response regulator